MKKVLIAIIITLILSSCNRKPFAISPEKPVPGDTVKISVKPNEFAVINMYFMNKPDSQLVVKNKNGYISFQIPDNIYYITYDIENNDSMIRAPEVLKIYNDSEKIAIGYYFAKGMLLVEKNIKDKAMDYFKKESDLYPSNYDALFKNLYIADYKINKDSIISALNDKYPLKKLLESTIIYYYRTGNIPLAQEYLDKFIKHNYSIDKTQLIDYVTYYNRNDAGTIVAVEKNIRGKKLKNNFILNMFYYSVMDNNIKKVKYFGNRYLSNDSTSPNCVDVLYWMYRMHLRKLNCVLPVAEIYPTSRYTSRIFKDYISMLINKNMSDSAFNFAKNVIDSHFLPDFVINFGYTIVDKLPDKSNEYLSLLNKYYSSISAFELRSYYTSKNYSYNDFINKKNNFFTYFFDMKSRLCKNTGDIKNAFKYAILAVKHLKMTDNDDSDILSNYATILYRANQLDKAKAVAFNILSQSPSDTISRNLIAKIIGNNNVDSIINVEINKRLRSNSLNIKAEDFTIKSMDGKIFSLNKLKGKIIVLNFWATWCGPCKLEIPFISKLPERFSDKNVIFLSISDEDSIRISKFLRSHPLKYNVCFNGKVVSNAYNIKAIPTHIIINKNGYIKYRHVGYIPGIEKKIEMEIRLLLK